MARRSALLACALALLAGCGTSILPERTDTRDPGGSVALRAIEIAAHDGPKRFEDGFYCASACTMWLGYDRTCVEPASRFGFHGIRNDATGISAQIYAAHLRDAHPDLLRWQRREANGDRMVRVSGAWLIERGWARPCRA